LNQQHPAPTTPDFFNAIEQIQPTVSACAIGKDAPIPGIRETLIEPRESTHLRPSCPRQQLVAPSSKRSSPTRLLHRLSGGSSAGDTAAQT
jgi:hypothetical protein